MRNVLDVKPGFWKEHPELWWEVDEIVNEVEILKETIDNEIIPAAESFRIQKPDLQQD